MRSLVVVRMLRLRLRLPPMAGSMDGAAPSDKAMCTKNRANVAAEMVIGKGNRHHHHHHHHQHILPRITTCACFRKQTKHTSSEVCNRSDHDGKGLGYKRCVHHDTFLNSEMPCSGN